MSNTPEDLLLELRSIIGGAVPIYCVGRSWDETYAGNVEFRDANGWRFTFFNDCDDLDYTDRVVSPSEIEIDYDALAMVRVDPISHDNYLSAAECDALKVRLKTATKWNPMQPMEGPR
jgi:hypothetical protein